MAAAKSRSWIHMLIFAATLTVTLYTLTDMEYPRLGLIRCSPANANAGQRGSGWLRQMRQRC